MTTDWKKQVRMDAEAARAILLSTGEVRPMFVIHTQTTVKMIGASWENPDQKRMMQKLIALQAAVDDAVGVVFIAEAWVASAAERRQGESDAAYKRRALRVVPSKAANRVEIISVIATYREHGEVHHAAVTHEILRDATGKPIDTKPYSASEEDDRFEPSFQMLLPALLTPPQREVAEYALDLMKRELGVHEHVQTMIHPAGHA